MSDFKSINGWMLLQHIFKDAVLGNADLVSYTQVETTNQKVLLDRLQLTRQFCKVM